MKFTVKTADWQRRMSVARRVLPRSGQPFHQALFLAVGDDGESVRMTASNGDQIYETTITAQVFEAGTLAVPGEQILAASAVVPGDTITIERSGAKTRVQSGRAEWMLDDLVGVSGDDAPAFPAADDDSRAAQVPVLTLVDALGQVQYAASKAISRPSFMQVHVGEGRVVAADGVRLHQTGFPETAAAFNIPVGVVDVLSEALGHEDDEVEVDVRLLEGAVLFAAGNTRFGAGTLTYEFPDVDSLILERARAQQGRVTVDRTSLVAALRVAGVASDDGLVTIMIGDQDGSMLVEAANQRAAGRMQLDVEVEASRHWRGSVPAQLLEDLLGRFPGPEITFWFSTEGKDGYLYAEAEPGMVAAVTPRKT